MKLESVFVRKFNTEAPEPTIPENGLTSELPEESVTEILTA